MRHLFQRGAFQFQDFVQVRQTFHVVVHFFKRGVRHKDHAVDALCNDLAIGLVGHFAGDRVDVEPDLVALDRAEGERDEIKIEGAVLLVGEGDGVPALVFVVAHGGVDVAQTGGFAAAGRAEVDDLVVQLFGLLIDEGHGGIVGGDIEKCQQN